MKDYKTEVDIMDFKAPPKQLMDFFRLTEQYRSSPALSTEMLWKRTETSSREVILFTLRSVIPESKILRK